MLLTGGKANRKSRSSGESEQRQRPLLELTPVLPSPQQQYVCVMFHSTTTEPRHRNRPQRGDTEPISWETKSGPIES